jgi:chromosome segregation ATPase
MAEEIMADDEKKSNRLSGAAWHQNRAQKEVDSLRSKLEHLKATIARGTEAQEQLGEARKALDVAEARLSAESREVALTNIPALAKELAEVTARLDASYSTTDHRRLHVILSTARSCGASGQSYESFRLASHRIQNGTSPWTWQMFNSWIKQPAEAA